MSRMDSRLAELLIEHGSLSVAQEREWFGSFDYHFDYLQSNFWRRIRRRIFKRDGKSCRCCRNEATDVHHLDYDIETIMGRRDDKLVSICKRCHGYVEYDGEKKITDMQQKLERFTWLVSVGGRLPIDDLEDELKKNGIRIHFFQVTKGRWTTLTFWAEERAKDFVHIKNFLYHQALDDRLLEVDGKLIHSLQKRALEALDKPGGAKNFCHATKDPRITYKMMEDKGVIRFPAEHRQTYLNKLEEYSGFRLVLLPPAAPG